MKPNERHALCIPAAPWGLRDLLFAILVVFGGIVALNLVLLAASRISGVPLAQDGNVLVIFVIAQDTLLLGAAWLFSAARYHIGWDRLGLRRFDVPLGCALGLGLLIASYAVRFCYVGAAYALGLRFAVQEAMTRLGSDGVGFPLALAIVALVAPIVEEIFFRGFLYGGLRGRIGVVGAMLASSVFFTALHFTLELFLPIFVLGLFLAWLYEYTGSLYPGILLHAANNALALIAFLVLQAAGLTPV